MGLRTFIYASFSAEILKNSDAKKYAGRTDWFCDRPEASIVRLNLKDDVSMKEWMVIMTLG